MKTQTEKNTAEIFVKMATDAWTAQNERVDKFLAEISDEELKAEIAPGKNSGVYLVGHLAAVNDNLFQILGLGEQLQPQLLEIFLKNPDGEEAKNYSINDLKKHWSDINAKLSEKFDELSPADWFAKHASVSEEDFAKEPHRNRLNVLLSRTIHQANHLGQLNILTGK
ncbi:MAG: DinB family protein [Acidobacteriota bacterium]